MSGAAAGVFPLRPRRRPGGLEHGIVRSVLRGAGAEIAGSRPYVAGDDVRTIDWAASARLSSARGATELIVRETFADRAPRVVTVVDRRPSMALYPAPWLHKPSVVQAVEELVTETAKAERALRGRLMLAGNGPRLETPAAHSSSAQDEERTVFDAPPEALTEGLRSLVGARGLVPGTFVFVVSDFLEPPAISAWAELLARRLDVVPVVVQDPLWESSFPAVGGVTLPLRDPRSRRGFDVRVSAKAAARRARDNAARLAGLLHTFDDLGLDHLRLTTAAPNDVLGAFTEWAEVRHATEGWAS
ncbi:MAG: DUF58 domain-containing protein [Gaiella sp.]